MADEKVVKYDKERKDNVLSSSRGGKNTVLLRYTFAHPVVCAMDAYIKESIQNPSAKIVKGFEKFDTGMPIYAGVLSDAQIESIILLEPASTVLRFLSASNQAMVRRMPSANEIVAW